MAMYSSTFTRWNATTAAGRYGAMLSTARALPLIIAALLPFDSGAQLRRDVCGMRQMAGFLVFCRDSGPGGRVTLGAEVRR